MPDAPKHREGPQKREPTKCLKGRSYGERLAKEASDYQLPEAQKKTDMSITPAAEAAHVSAYLVPPESPQPKQLCQLHTQHSLGQSCHRQIKSLVSMHTELLWSCPALCDPVDCGLPGFCQGVLQARILERVGQFWLTYLFRALYFLLP